MALAPIVLPEVHGEHDVQFLKDRTSVDKTGPVSRIENISNKSSMSLAKHCKRSHAMVKPVNGS